MNEIVDGELVDPATGELVPYTAPPPVTLFRTDEPAEVLARATDTANQLARVVREQRLIVRIGQSDHARVEAWTMLGSLLGVYPVCVWTRKLDDGWEARVEARTRDGAIVGAAEAECLRSERTWKGRDDYALRSMAQTRATSKALRQPLGFVMTLAGFSATPAEEMPAHPDADPQPEREPEPSEFVAPPINTITDPQYRRMRAIQRGSKVPDDVFDVFVRNLGGVESSKQLPKERYDAVVAAIENWRPPAVDADEVIG